MRKKQVSYTGWLQEADDSNYMKGEKPQYPYTYYHDPPAKAVEMKRRILLEAR